MGLFSFRKPPARVNSSGSVPHTADLLYPAVLPAFSEIAAGEHRDPRAGFLHHPLHGPTALTPIHAGCAGRLRLRQ